MKPHRLLAPRLLVIAALLPLVSACATAVSSTAPRSRASAQVPPQDIAIAPRADFRAARVMSLPGLEAVMGADANALVRQFGTPRLDVWEGDARKLQFTGQACILDVYLYPSAPGRTETATYVDARRSDGQDVDRASCVQALKL